VFADDPRVAGEQAQPQISEVGKPEVSKLVQFGFQARTLTDDERALTPEKHGVMVTRVEPGTFAADEIGMVDRDIIVSLNRQPVNSVDDIKKVQARLKPGDPVVFQVIRSMGVAGRRGSAATTPATQSLYLSGTLPE
jgi:S1-C subfamily serine protease